MRVGQVLTMPSAYHLRIANKGVISRQMVDWRHSLEQKWAFAEASVK